LVVANAMDFQNHDYSKKEEEVQKGKEVEVWSIISSCLMIIRASFARNSTATC